MGIHKQKKRWDISTLPNVLFTLLVCVVCWILGYQNRIGFPLENSDKVTILWDIVCGFFTDRDYTYFVGFVLLVLSAALIQRFNFRFVICRGKTVLPFLFFLFLNSVNPDFFPIRPVSIAIFPILFTLFELFGSYQNPTAVSKIFNMMFFLCAGSLFFPFMLWFIPVFWIGMYQFRILDMRSFLASLLGIFTFFLLLSGWSIWKHDWAVFANIADCLSDYRMVFANKSLYVDWIKPLCFFIVMLVLFFYISSQENEQSIRTRQFLTFLFLFCLYTFILFLFYTHTFADFEMMFYLPASLLAAYSFSGKGGVISFIIYYVILIVLIAFLLMRLWNFL